MDEVYKVTGPEIKIKNKTDILECEVKWALKSITKQVEVVEFQLSYFKS